MWHGERRKRENKRKGRGEGIQRKVNEESIELPWVEIREKERKHNQGHPERLQRERREN